MEIDFDKYNSIEKVDLLTPIEFENWIADLFNKMGYKTSVTRPTSDYGVDVLLVFNSKLICVQVKKYTQTVGVKSVQEIFSGTKFYNADEGWVITTAFNYSRQAIRLSKSLGIKLFNRQDIVNWLEDLNNWLEIKSCI